MINPKYIKIEVGKVILTVQCHMCNEDKIVELTTQEYNDYFVRGIHIQHAMPKQSDNVRELLISGTCGKCFDELFAEEDEDE